MTFTIEDDVSPETLLRRAAEHFGDDLVLTTAFGLEGSVLLHMIGAAQLPIRVVTLDTGLFFEETRRTWAELEQRLGLRVEAIRPELSLEAQAHRHGPELWARAPDRCCEIRKVRPLRQVLSTARGWITGIRRAQSPERAHAAKVGWEPRFEVTKINPLADWSDGDVRAYLTHHHVPYNPMFDDGYPSIGCTPCTRPVTAGEDPRAGRWAGFEKRECGLHWATGDEGTVQLPRPAEATS